MGQVLRCMPSCSSDPTLKAGSWVNVILINAEVSALCHSIAQVWFWILKHKVQTDSNTIAKTKSITQHWWRLVFANEVILSTITWMWEALRWSELFPDVEMFTLFLSAVIIVTWVMTHGKLFSCSYITTLDILHWLCFKITNINERSLYTQHSSLLDIVIDLTRFQYCQEYCFDELAEVGVNLPRRWSPCLIGLCFIVAELAVCWFPIMAYKIGSCITVCYLGLGHQLLMCYCLLSSHVKEIEPVQIARDSGLFSSGYRT